jgi:hypothetical protein
VRDNVIRGPWPVSSRGNATGVQTVVGEMLDLFGAAIGYLKAFGDGMPHEELAATLFKSGVAALNGVVPAEQASTCEQLRSLTIRAADVIESLVKSPGSLAPRDSIGWLIALSLRRFHTKTDALTAEAFLEGTMPG